MENYKEKCVGCKGSGEKSNRKCLVCDGIGYITFDEDGNKISNTKNENKSKVLKETMYDDMKG